jgi:hypothetical protein
MKCVWILPLKIKVSNIEHKLTEKEKHYNVVVVVMIMVWFVLMFLQNKEMVYATPPESVLQQKVVMKLRKQHE